MPIVALFLIVISLSYQLFFRFEHWTEANRPGLVFERDNLTGQVHQFAPGENIPFLSRITGHYPSDRDEEEEAIETPTVATTTSTPEKPVAAASTANPTLAMASSQAPVPAVAPATGPETATAMVATVSPTPVQTTQAANGLRKAPTPPLKPVQYVENAVDLNGDGRQEKVTLRRDHPDGLVDITVLDGQREVFYGRGERLQMLTSRRNGWSDIILIGKQGQQSVFQFSAQEQEYVLGRASNPPEPKS